MDRIVGRRIRDLREAQYYTRDYLAEKVGISQKFLYEIECGKKGFSAEILVRLANALSVSCDYILLGEEDGQRGNQKIFCVLEQIKQGDKSRMVKVLEVLIRLLKDE